MTGYLDEARAGDGAGNPAVLPREGAHKRRLLQPQGDARLALRVGGRHVRAAADPGGGVCRVEGVANVRPPAGGSGGGDDDSYGAVVWAKPWRRCGSRSVDASSDSGDSI